MKDDRLYIIHILECIARIESYTAKGPQDFQSSMLIQDAVLRNLQTLAESSQKTSDSLKQDHPEIDWRGLAGFRNVLVHDYLGVDVSYVWNVVERELPELKTRLEKIKKELNRH